MVVLSGCMSDDWRAAIAQERVIVAENNRSHQAAQIDQTQSADSDRRDATAMLLALHAQQAIVAGEAVIADADSQTAIVESNNKTLVLVADRIIEATRPDHRPLYAGLCAIVVIIVAWLVLRRPRPAEPVTPPRPRRVVYRTRHAIAWLLTDDTIILHRYRDGREIVYLPGDEMYSRLAEVGR